jgi:hypothetical protein
MTKWRGWVTFSVILSAGHVAIALATTEGSESKLTPYQKNAVITGQIAATKNCTETSDKRPPEVWLAMGQILLYQVEVPLNGNYEFHVVPGKYDLLVTNSGGCLDQTEVKVEPKQIAQINLRLSSDRSPAATGKRGVK